MPKGRIVVRSITESKKLAALETDGARLLYTWLVIMVDCEGRFTGDPFLVNARVFVRLGKPQEEVEEYLQDLENKNLIVRWIHQGDMFLCLPNFHEKTPGTNRMKEAKSEIPDPPKELIQDWEKRVKSGLTLDQVQTNSGSTLASKDKNKDKNKDKEDIKRYVRKIISKEEPESEEFLIKVEGKKKIYFMFDQGDQTPLLEEDGFEPIDVKAVQYLINRILENDERVHVINNLTPKRIKTWFQESKRLRLINEAPVEEIAKVMKWCQDDTFWRVNILSMAKFRQQYDKLRLQMKRDRPTYQDKYGPGLKAFKELMKNEKE